MSSSVEPSTLQELQRRYGDAVDGVIASWFDQGEDLRPFYGMMRYQLGHADENFEPVSLAGRGKRFRPALCLLACEAVGGRWEGALTCAACIEILHNFSLIHDDIEDRDPTRRHRPTVWKLWGEAQAINAGDGMFAKAGRHVLDASEDPQVVRQLARGFQDMALALTQGQYLDMRFETQESVSPSEYLGMIERKTAAIVAFALWSGAVLGGGSETTSEDLRTFGRELGKAFQIRDDVMGMWAERDVTGKERAKDLENRKKTLPVLIALDRTPQDGRDRLLAYLQRQSDDMDMAMDLIDRSGARRACEIEAERFVAAALDALERAQIEPRARDQLISLARELGLAQV